MAVCGRCWLCNRKFECASKRYCESCMEDGEGPIFLGDTGYKLCYQCFEEVAVTPLGGVLVSVVDLIRRFDPIDPKERNQMKKTKRPIILCCGQNGRAVVFGYVTEDPTPGESVTLTDARMILRWDAQCGGLFGLAANGPKGDTRITAEVATVTETVWQEWLSVSPNAVQAIRDWDSV